MVGDEEFNADDLRDVVPMSIDDFDAAAVDAAAFVKECLLKHLRGFALVPIRAAPALQNAATAPIGPHR